MISILKIDIKPICQSSRIYMSILKLILTKKLDKLESKLSLLKRKKKLSNLFTKRYK